MKVHFNATFHQLTKKATVGILVRNKKGLLMEVCTYPYENVVDSTATNEKACLRDIIFIEELRF